MASFEQLINQEIAEQKSTADTVQYGRVFGLTVFDRNNNGIDLSELRCKFSVKKTDNMTPNIAEIRVYNVSSDVAIQVQRQFKRVILQGGYESNFGVIFQGNIRQVIIGRESATDTFVDIIAGDGLMAYNYAIVNTTIAAGATQEDQVKASLQSMTSRGITQGHVGDIGTSSLPRGKVMFGQTKNYLRNISQSTDTSWSIQNEQLQFVSNTSYLPGERILINSQTGMIGSPQQTVNGINVKVLMNPKIKVSTRVQLTNDQDFNNPVTVEQIKINFNTPGTPQNTPSPLSQDGVYYVFIIEHSGDTRGVEWYTSLVCLTIDVSANPANSISAVSNGFT